MGGEPAFHPSRGYNIILQNIQTGSGAHTDSYALRTGGDSLPKVKVAGV